MTLAQQIITIGMVVLGTMFTRFVSFLVFPDSKIPPRYVTYLGTVLPYAVMGLLIVYCLKDVPGSRYLGLPELLGILCVVLVHRWKKNMLLSIAAGTIFYMVLVQTCFVA